MSKIQNRNLVGIFGSGKFSTRPTPIGGVIAPDNAVATVLAANVFADLNLGSSAGLISNAVGWTLTNATTGEITYQGSGIFSGTIIAVLTVKSDAATPLTTLRVLKNGVPLSDDAQASSQMSVNDRELKLLSPIRAVKGDTLKLQVKTFSGVDVTIVHTAYICRSV